LQNKYSFFIITNISMKPKSKQLNALLALLSEDGVKDTINWRAWYWLVLGALAAEIGFFAYLTNLFA